MNLLWPTCTFVELETGDPLEGYKAESNLVKMQKKKKNGVEAAQSHAAGLAK